MVRAQGEHAERRDEPFEGVSTALSRRLAQTIRDFQQAEHGVAVLVAESDLKRAAMLARRAFVIERGEVIEEAALQETVRSDALRQPPHQ